MTADIDLARQRLEEDVLDDVADLLSIVKHPDRALRKLKPEDRLAGLKPEDRLADLPAAQAVLALPDEVLRALSPEYIASLPADVQSTIRTRLQRA